MANGKVVEQVSLTIFALKDPFTSVIRQSWAACIALHHLQFGVNCCFGAQGTHEELMKAGHVYYDM